MGPAPRSAAAPGTDPGRRRKRTRRAGGRRPLRKGNPRSPARAPGGAGLPGEAGPMPGGAGRGSSGAAAAFPEQRGAGPGSDGQGRLVEFALVGGLRAGLAEGAERAGPSTAVGVAWAGGGAGGAPGWGCREGRAVPPDPVALGPRLPRTRGPPTLTLPAGPPASRSPEVFWNRELGLLVSTKGWETVTVNTHLFFPEQHNWSIWNIPGSQVGDCLCCLFLWLLTALEDFSQHTQIAALMAETGMDEQGLALTMVQGGPYLQITSLEEKSFAFNDGKPKPGKKNQ
ncbi:collagen alpha-1(I) chain-like [Ammospiza nelsoni]|uniref:collagen alpha-1(I) chain-like n=1 Tax=Ammospiza nelsoni TaxID=2857394 RepID=UPI002869D58B|nr:collagen alpha-1(I) chain-like [Ammospiza nelsoni]